MKATFNYTQEKKEAVKKLATILKSFGYDVYISGSGQYGFFTNAEGNRVICFQIDFSWFHFSINHKGKNIGTGYQITSDGVCPIYSFEWATKQYFESLVNSRPYHSRRKNETFERWTTKDEHLAFYGSSSKYSLFN